MGPHTRLFTGVPAKSPQETVLARLFDLIWEDYRLAVPHVVSYERVISDAGAAFVNDHIAFRTLGNSEPYCGMASLSRVFEALGYRAAGCYDFPGKHLAALHFQHPRKDFPKLFISELKLWELNLEIQQSVARLLETSQPTDPALLCDLADLKEDREDGEDGVTAAVDQLASLFQRRWAPPDWNLVQRMNALSQYGAWTLLHGFRVNHFTSLINSHGVPSLDDLPKTVAALRAAGTPMKEEIEGEAGSKLRQTATAAADCKVAVTKDGNVSHESWTYAYFELAERGMIDINGKAQRFEGFLGAQATELFEMTQTDPAPK